jgi:teichuronic acid biosynthesis glycosyltransferase TuaG
MATEAPLVSILMPSFNSARFLADAVESVIAQTYCDWELIVCDDGSSDDTAVIAGHYARLDPRVVVIDNSYKKGAPGARNSALNHASGKYIAFLDSDDLWLPDKLECQINFMQRNNFLLTFTYHDVINEVGDFVCHYRAPMILSKKKLLVTNFMACLTVIYDAEEIGKVMQPDILTRNDYALWLTIFSKGLVDRAYCLPKNTALYRRNSYGLSSGNYLKLLRYYGFCLRTYGGMSTAQSFGLMIPYLLLSIIKKAAPGFYNRIVDKI